MLIGVIFALFWPVDMRKVILLGTAKLETTRNNNEGSCSALDKLLGQLGIYATWLSSIAYLQKQLLIFIFFTPHFFPCDYMFSIA